MREPYSYGLPKELYAWDEISKDTQLIRISTDKRRYGKIVTIIDGFNTKDVDIDDVAKTLKKKIAAGGTVKKGRIELQGDHREKVKKVLSEMGFNVELVR